MSSRLPKPEHDGTLGWFRERGLPHEIEQCSIGCLLHDHTECCSGRALARAMAAHALRVSRARERLFLKAILG